jgi:hypothetical protein
MTLPAKGTTIKQRERQLFRSNERHYPQREQQSHEGNDSCYIQMNDTTLQREQQSHEGNDSCYVRMNDNDDFQVLTI